MRWAFCPGASPEADERRGRLASLVDASLGIVREDKRVCRFLAALDEGEQQYWKDTAKEYNDSMKAEYKRLLEEPPDQSPEARQKYVCCISLISHFLTRVLERSTPSQNG